MATIKEGMRAYLLADAAIAAVVGGKCHDNQVPEQSSLPWIWYRRTGREAERLLDGTESIVTTRFAVECAADNPSGAEDLADLVRDRLDGQAGDIGGFTAKGVFVEDADDDYFPESIDDEAGAHVTALIVEVLHD